MRRHCNTRWGRRERFATLQLVAILLLALALSASAQSNWTIDTFAGSVPGPNGDALDAFFGNPTDLDIDDQGAIYLSDSEFHWIRQITPDGRQIN